MDKLEQMKPAVGTPLKLAFTNPELNAGSRLLGYWPGRSLLVRTPSRDGKPLLFKQGRQVRVTFMQSREVVGFNTEVLQEILHPYPYLHLVWPEEIEQVVVRKAPRVAVELIAAIQVEGEGEQAGRIVDISRNGCALLMKNDATVLEDDNLQLRFRASISGVEQFFTVDGVVRSVEAGENLQQIGVEFMELPEKQLALLEAFVNQELVRQSQHL